MNGKKTRPEDEYTTIECSRAVKRRYKNAVEVYYGKDRGFLRPTTDEALEVKTEELLAKIEARDKNR